MMTILALGVLTLINYVSTRIGGAVQTVFTIAKVLAIVLLIGGLFFSGHGSFGNFMHSSGSIKFSGTIALIAAMVAATNGAAELGTHAIEKVKMRIEKCKVNRPRRS